MAIQGLMMDWTDFWVSWEGLEARAALTFATRGSKAQGKPGAHSDPLPLLSTHLELLEGEWRLMP